MENQSTGFLLVNKPSGPTSHDIIDELRRIAGVKRIGHAGTLDPFASGLLIVGIGREATKHLGRFMKLDKTYRATLELGAVSDTFDLTGKIERRRDQRPLAREEIEAMLKRFRGRIEQLPPMYSAKKIGGKRLYELARRGIEIERRPAQVEIFELELSAFAWPALELLVHCSPGTYIRSLASDLGEALGCGAYLKTLERTAINGYNLKEAQTLDTLARNWRRYLFT